MQHDFKIVILTAGYGNGHHQVSRTLQQSFYRNGIHNVRIVDLFEEAHPGMNRISRYLYLRSPIFSAFGFDFYGWSYYLTKNMENDGALAKWLNLLGMKRLLGIVKEERPDAIVSTFPFGGVSEQLKKKGLSIPVFTVVTDFRLHNRWLLTDSNRYYVATEDLKSEMISRGVQSGKICVSGIPVREHFYDCRNMRDNRTDKRTILVITGLYGILSDLRKLAASLLAIPDARIDIVCGENDKLKRELERSFGHEPRLSLYGYVDALHERMRQAACVITKAGGITLSEAIQIGTPILIFKPFPGQEKENARYLESKGAAFVADGIRELAAGARKLLLSGENRRRMVKLYEKFASGRAAETIVQDVLSMVSGRRSRSALTKIERIGV